MIAPLALLPSMVGSVSFPSPQEMRAARLDALAFQPADRDAHGREVVGEQVVETQFGLDVLQEAAGVASVRADDRDPTTQTVESGPDCRTLRDRGFAGAAWSSPGEQAARGHAVLRLADALSVVSGEW
jgi:hypothetical protein